MGAAGFWRLDAAAELSNWAHQHQYESRKWCAKSRIPGPGCPADGYKMVLCLCPAKAAHNCCPIRSLLAGGPRNRFMSTAIPKNVHAYVRVTAIYIHNNSEKCPWRGPSNSIQLLTGFEGNRWSVGPEDELLPEAEGRGQQFIWGTNRWSVVRKPRQQLFCYTPFSWIMFNYERTGTRQNDPLHDTKRNTFFSFYL